MNINLSEKIKKIEINNPSKIAKIMAKILEREQEIDKKKEHFWGVYFDARNHIVRIELINLGIVNANLIHPRETFRPAIESSACALMVAHNHPSGDTSPSQSDLEITKRLIEAGKILGIDLLDHLIINETGEFYSFKEKKLF